jgi:hypothetical protein
MRWLGAISIAGFVLVALFWSSTGGRRPPGVLVSEEPEQREIWQPTAWKVGNYHLIPLATYHIRARVLLAEHYWFGREAELSPVDLTVGWRLMSNQDVLDQLRLYSVRRAFTWQGRGSKLPAREDDIIAHCANMHLIPANPQIAEQIKDMGKGDVVDLNGYLVEVDAPDGWRWRSSLVRTDTGEGACELMWVVKASKS